MQLIILMDILMPEMNGYEAAKAIRAMNDRPDGKTIPIIAMTANSFAEDVQASLDAVLIFPFCQHDFRLSTHEHTYAFSIQRLEIRCPNIHI